MNASAGLSAVTLLSLYFPVKYFTESSCKNEDVARCLVFMMFALEEQGKYRRQENMIVFA